MVSIEPFHHLVCGFKSRGSTHRPVLLSLSHWLRRVVSSTTSSLSSSTLLVSSSLSFVASVILFVAHVNFVSCLSDQYSQDVPQSIHPSMCASILASLVARGSSAIVSIRLRRTVSKGWNLKSLVLAPWVSWSRWSSGWFT